MNGCKKREMILFLQSDEMFFIIIIIPSTSSPVVGPPRFKNRTPTLASSCALESGSNGAAILLASPSDIPVAALR
jgi:hypothetical protein